MTSDSTGLGIRFRPGVSVVLRHHPEGPVMITLCSQCSLTGRPRWVVAWLDGQGQRCEQLFDPEELVEATG